ncbi:N-acetylglucosamine-specific PTS transporter subunit IIBC [Pontibacillus litoralis]|uniref:PTS N-acetylglucosamine transporter subunit IIABC n=1 Tax=Pontibacillus litoralis JSM 072002 TaxID=1385512 RepID=A0A0A5GAF6_9BACI|nr:N-acetylglucosamine-specific PTS transporter subunit IIBC [Pontibacillus litoralis]KGX88183.1 PTS N-acetylglucosamine transporter subunit IIABC [Pontibacillus litoralis JSM 072002]
MLNFLQRIGKSLMLPIATLPAAALLVRLGMEDMFNLPFITAAGNGILTNLAIIFAIGIAIGLSRDGNGAAALSGAIGYLVLTEGLSEINADLDMGVFGGIIAGIAGGLLYNRFHNIKLPDYLAFFGGKRFVPIITSLTMIGAAFVLGIVWPVAQSGIDSVGNWILGSGAVGVGVYGFLNRLLIPIGLHHVMNTLIWFDFGSFTNEAGDIVRGEINRFLNGDESAGYFLAGFYPVMMFGLPAACLAMYAAAKENKKAIVGGMLFSIGFTAFLTGVTEPIEFSFMFLSPLLYAVHAILTGVSMVLAFVFDVRHGFGFSAGAIDFVLNFSLAENPFTLLIVGLVMAVIYFFVFYTLIIKLDLKTPGREDEEEEIESSSDSKDYDEKAYYYVEALGGVDNIQTLDYCTTRLRLELVDRNKINEKELTRQGARGVVKIGKRNLQVIVGTTVEFLADEMKQMMESGVVRKPESLHEESAKEQKSSGKKELGGNDFVSPIDGDIMPLTEVPDQVFAKKMMGPGFAINPTGSTFHSPIDGKVLNIFPTKHAIGLETNTGVEILIHIGLDTVKLKGEGFTSLVEEGQAIKKGTPLIDVNLPYIKENAPSVITPVVFTNLEEESLELLQTGVQSKGTNNIISIQ